MTLQRIAGIIGHFGNLCLTPNNHHYIQANSYSVSGGLVKVVTMSRYQSLQASTGGFGSCTTDTEAKRANIGLLQKWTLPPI